MPESKDVFDELSFRIQADIDHFGGVMPERNAISWRGYLAAMVEWSLLPLELYQQLVARLPPVEDDPAMAIMTGRE